MSSHSRTASYSSLRNKKNQSYLQLSSASHKKENVDFKKELRTKKTEENYKKLLKKFE